MITFPLAVASGPKRFKTAAFTLLELLVVISIIAVLAGILLPVTGAVMENAKKTEAKSTATQIVTAVKSFQTDYGVYPVPSGTVTTTDTTYTPSTNASLFAILRASDTNSAGSPSPNSRRIVYFEGKDVKNAKVPKSGFATAQATTSINGLSITVPIGTLVDPWGVGFMVRYDTGYDDLVMLPEPEGNTPTTNKDSAGQTTGILRTGVIAWSYGKDGKAGNNGNFGTAPTYTYGDDVVTWQ